GDAVVILVVVFDDLVRVNVRAVIRPVTVRPNNNLVLAHQALRDFHLGGRGVTLPGGQVANVVHRKFEGVFNLGHVVGGEINEILPPLRVGGAAADVLDDPLHQNGLAEKCRIGRDNTINHQIRTWLSRYVNRPGDEVIILVTAFADLVVRVRLNQKEVRPVLANRITSNVE